MKIRIATEEDAAAISGLLHEMSEIRTVISRTIEETRTITGDNLKRAAKTNCSTVFLAETEEGTVAGYCAVHWVPFLFFAGGEAYISEVFVRPRESGRGVGTNLLDAAIAEARKRGCTRLSLLNGRDGEAYRRNFYAQRGWVERERMANFIFPLGNSPEPRR